MNFSKIFTIFFLIFSLLACKKEKGNSLPPDIPELRKEIILGVQNWSADTTTKFLVSTLTMPSGYSADNILSVYQQRYNQPFVKIDSVNQLGIYYKIQGNKVELYSYCPYCTASGIGSPGSTDYAVRSAILYVDGVIFYKVKIVFR